MELSTMFVWDKDEAIEKQTKRYNKLLNENKSLKADLKVAVDEAISLKNQLEDVTQAESKQQEVSDAFKSEIKKLRKQLKEAEKLKETLERKDSEIENLAANVGELETRVKTQEGIIADLTEG